MVVFFGVIISQLGFGALPMKQEKEETGTTKRKDEPSLPRKAGFGRTVSSCDAALLVDELEFTD